MLNHTLTQSELVMPRALSRQQAAVYLGVSPSTVDRLVASGALHVVQLPISNIRGAAVTAINRRVLLDRAQCDALIEASRVSRGLDR